MSEDIIANSPTAQVMDMFGVRVNSVKAIEAGLDFSMAIESSDVNEHGYTEVSNGNMVTVDTDSLESADTTLFIDKADLTKVPLGQTTFPELLKRGAAGTSGEASNLMALGSVIEMPNAKFAIVPLKK